MTVVGLASSETGRRTSRKLGLMSSGIGGSVTFWEEAAARGAVRIVVDILGVMAARNEIMWVVVQVEHDKDISYVNERPL